MRRFMFFVSLLIALPVAASVFPVQTPQNSLRDVMAKRFRREDIRNHWIQATLKASMLIMDLEGMTSARRMAQMPLAWIDESGIRVMGGWDECVTKFLVILPEDVHYLDAETQKTLQNILLCYLADMDIIVVTEDIEATDVSSGMDMLLAAMQANLPRDNPAIQNPQYLTEWRERTVERLAKETAGN